MKRENIKSVLHMLAGLISFFYACILFTEDRHEFSFFFIITGAFFMLVATTSKNVKKGFLFNGGVFFLIEGLVISLVSGGYFLKKNEMLAFLFSAIALMYIIMAATCIHRAKQKKSGGQLFMFYA